MRQATARALSRPAHPQQHQSFADAPDQDEIARGLQRLANDIGSGRIKEVIRKFAYEGGDYMFTVAER